MTRDSKLFSRVVFRGFEPVFASGFVLCDPERLDQFYGDKVQGFDLLARFEQTNEGHIACQQGIIVPILSVEPHEYTLVVRHPDSETFLQSAPYITSAGWLLGTDTGKLVLCNLNNLMFWDPWDTYEYDNNYNRYESFSIMPGWYQVEFQGGINSEGSDEEEWVFEYILKPVPERPDFAASLQNASNYFHQVAQATESVEMIMGSSEAAEDIGREQEGEDSDLLRTLLSRLNTNAFEAFIVELFSKEESEPFSRLQDVGDGVFYQPLLDSYGRTLDSVFLLHYLPLGTFQNPERIQIAADPLLAHRLEKVRTFYKGKFGYFGMVSESLVKAAKLRSLAILTNLAGIDKDYYQSNLIPKYRELAQSLDLFVPSFLVGSYDSFLDLNASGTEKVFKGFLSKNSEGVTISLSEESIHVARFTYETSLQGVFRESKYLYEPVFFSFGQQEQFLADFEALIRSETREAELEDFLAAHFRDIFGSNYDRIETQIWLKFPELDISHKNRRLDVFLRNSVINDWELFEIKRAIPLTRTYRDVPVIVSEVSYAVQQIKNYARILSQDSVKRRLAQEGIEYYEPSLNLVVGKTPQIPHEQWRWLVSNYDKDVKILTFDDLLEQMRQRLRDRVEFLLSYGRHVGKS